MKTQRWQDWVMLAFGIWVLVSPFWMPAYVSQSDAAAWNSYASGAAVAIFAGVALGSPKRWPEWVELALGIWLIIAPFVLAFYNFQYGAAWNQIILGALVVIDAIWILAAYPSTRVRA